MTVAAIRRKFYLHGVLLFLVGLLTGAVANNLPFPRMALSAHLEGVMNGGFLVLLGVIWPELRLSAGQARLARGLAFYGTYANWLATTLGALFGTSGLTPQAGAGHVGAGWQEALVAALLVTLSLAMVACCGLLLRGLAGPPVEEGR